MMAPCHLKLSKPHRKCLISPNLGDALESTNISLKMERACKIRVYQSFTTKGKLASSGCPPPTLESSRATSGETKGKRDCGVSLARG